VELTAARLLRRCGVRHEQTWLGGKHRAEPPNRRDQSCGELDRLFHALIVATDSGGR
jgi:hypothetical protein